MEKRVTSRTQASRAKEIERVVPHSKVGKVTEELLGVRVDRGYRKGYRRASGKRIAVLRYTLAGVPALRKRVLRDVTSRQVHVGAEERRSLISLGGGTVRRRTTVGRRTVEQALEKGVGGIRAYWVY